jgi:pimeloyl-ACP methyl ester carboxylesterase
MANDIRALFQQLEIEKVSVIGYNWGAPLPASQRPPAISIGWSHGHLDRLVASFFSA